MRNRLLQCMFSSMARIVHVLRPHRPQWLRKGGLYMAATSHAIGRVARHLALVASLLGSAASIQAAPVVFSLGGTDAASILGTVNDFRAALGEPNNGNAPGPLPGGRREINWDGGGAVVAAVSGSTLAAFTNIRGATFTTPGTGFLQTPLTDPALTGINPTYATTFGFFSPVRIFTPVGSNITDVTFSIPGTAGLTPATVSGFGAVFTDVDLADITQMLLFDANDAPLGSFFAPQGGAADASLSFLGVVFNAGEQIARVRLITGNSAPGPNDGGGIDVVAMDDFLYGEPRLLQAAVPEPATWTLLLLGGLAALRWPRRATHAAGGQAAG
jgi:hypothetical protein